MIKIGILQGIFWGVFASMLGFSIFSSWQAWAIILAGNI